MNKVYRGGTTKHYQIRREPPGGGVPLLYYPWRRRELQIWEGGSTHCLSAAAAAGAAGQGGSTHCLSPAAAAGVFRERGHPTVHCTGGSCSNKKIRIIFQEPQAKIYTIFMDSSMKNTKITNLFACGASEKSNFFSART